MFVRTSSAIQNSHFTIYTSQVILHSLYFTCHTDTFYLIAPSSHVLLLTTSFLATGPCIRRIHWRCFRVLQLSWETVTSYKPVSRIRYKVVCTYSEDSNRSVHPHSLVSLNFPPREALDSWLSIERPSKTLIRLRGCAGWSESSMGSHAYFYLLLVTDLIIDYWKIYDSIKQPPIMHVCYNFRRR